MMRGPASVITIDAMRNDARLRLAHVVLVVAREDSQDPDGLKNDGVQVMAKAYRDRP